MKINRFLQIVSKLLISIALLTITLMFLSCSENSLVPTSNSDYENIKYELITFLTNNEYDRSKELLNILEKQYAGFGRSKKCDYHYFNGCYFYSIKQFDQAEKEFSECLQLNEAYLQALYSRAELRCNYIEDYHGSILDYEKLLELLDYCENINYFSKDSQIKIYSISGGKYNYLPYIAEKVIQEGNLINSFGSVTLSPDNLRKRCYGNMITLHYDNQEYRKAIDSIKQAKTKKLSSQYSGEILAECYFKLEEYQNAIDAYNNYLLFHDETRYINYKLGLSYFFLEDFNKSLSEFNKVLINFKDIKNSIINYSPHYPDQNIVIEQNQNALKGHQKLFQSALLYRARSYGELREYAKGIDDLNQIIDLKPDNINAHYYRGYFYNYHDDRELALKDFLKVLKLDPTRNSVNYSVALLYDSKGQFEKAIQYYEEFISNNSQTNSQKYINAVGRIRHLK